MELSNKRDGTIVFYDRINKFIKPWHTVLDLGAGRACWYEDDPVIERKNHRLMKGKVKLVIAADVDPVVLKNKASDKQVIISGNDLKNFDDCSFDVVIADYVLEHIENPDKFSREILRVLKPDGLFAARTPHKYSYVAFMANVIGEKLQTILLKKLQPNRKEKDVFPVKYKLNTLRNINNSFCSSVNNSYIFKTEPAYYFENKYLFIIFNLIHFIMPKFFSGNIFVYIYRKNINSES
jgi:SAM-dependent methyltransferase